jgi:hypothetical protein
MIEMASDGTSGTTRVDTVAACMLGRYTVHNETRPLFPSKDRDASTIGCNACMHNLHIVLGRGIPGKNMRVDNSLLMDQAKGLDNA